MGLSLELCFFSNSAFSLRCLALGGGQGRFSWVSLVNEDIPEDQRWACFLEHGSDVRSLAPMRHCQYGLVCVRACGLALAYDPRLAIATGSLVLVDGHAPRSLLSGEKLWLLASQGLHRCFRQMLPWRQGIV